MTTSLINTTNSSVGNNFGWKLETRRTNRDCFSTPEFFSTCNLILGVEVDTSLRQRCLLRCAERSAERRASAGRAQATERAGRARSLQHNHQRRCRWRGTHSARRCRSATPSRSSWASHPRRSRPRW